MKLHNPPVTKRDSRWRRWMRGIREFEHAMMVTDQDLLIERMEAIEHELLILRSLVTEQVTSRHIEGEVSDELA